MTKSVKKTELIKPKKKIVVQSIGKVTKDFSGFVYAIDPYIDTETRTFKLIGLIKNNKNFSLKPGMMVNVKIILDSRNALTVPEGSIIPEDENTYVYIINQKSRAIKKQVQTGRRKDGLIEITGGIAENTLVIYEGTNKIKPGVIVKTVN